MEHALAASLLDDAGDGVAVLATQRIDARQQLRRKAPPLADVDQDFALASLAEQDVLADCAADRLLGRPGGERRQHLGVEVPLHLEADGEQDVLLGGKVVIEG